MKVRPFTHAENDLPGNNRNNKLRVAAYCRVSTLLESQQSSISAQKLHYIDYIASNPDWELADLYMEVGISVTNA